MRRTASPASIRRSRPLGLALGTLVMACACQAVPARQDGQAVAVLATRPLRCPDQGPQVPQGPQEHGASAETFLDPGRWQAHLAGIDAPSRAALASWPVDFAAGESVVLVRAGAVPNPGYRVAIARHSLPVRDGTLQVDLLLEPPPRHLLQAQVIVFPCTYLRLDQAGYRQVTVVVERRAPP